MNNNFVMIDSLYKLYGYEKIKSDDNYGVYRYKQGIYYAVDIVKLSAHAETDIIRDQYSKIGYATDVIHPNSYNEIEDRLYYGFFEVESSSLKLKNKYKKYIEKQNKILAGEYRYIPCPYKIIKEEESNESKQNINTSNTIVENIIEYIKDDKAKLLLIEAAAGFGKTSTVYQVLKELKKNDERSSPIFIELSKNRQAKIFKHVLLNEFEQTYPYLKYELIIHEIQCGKIPLIIDGFDELLYSGTQEENEKKQDDFEDIQAMLQTIGEVIKDKAKVILTTRRTAVFAGDNFFNWTLENSKNFLTIRCLLEKPDIASWIGHDRYNKLKHCGIPINNLSNPVLLSYIRNVDNNKFQECCENPDILVQGYFDKILKREQDRQELLITPNDQLSIFSNLAKSFVEYKINSEDKLFIKELIQSENENLLIESIHKYTPSERPTLDDITDTLSNHALLDRKGTLEDKIGFINDFIYGYLISTAICNQPIDWIEKYFLDDQYVLLASTAFKVSPQKNKDILKEKIEYIADILDHSTLLVVDLDLTGKPNHNFNGVEFGSLEISDANFTSEFKFSNCTFTDCVFTNSELSIESFSDVTFLNCSFSNCSVSGDINNIEGNRWILAGEDYGGNFINFFTQNKPAPQDTDIKIDFEKKVLEQFWLPGRDKYTPRRRIRTLYKGFEISKRSPITEAINTLIEKGLLLQEDDSAIINKIHIHDIMVKLGRS